MEKRRGAFIVIEGADGSGKSTQFALLKKRLELAGHDVAVFKFPRYESESSYFVRRYLDGAYGKADEVGPYTGSLFYALDRFEAAPEIKAAIDAGKIVLCDRFSASNMAHQGTKIDNAEQRRGFFIWLDNLEFEMLRIPRPDISFVLRVPAELAAKLAGERSKGDIHESDFSHLERAVAVYDDLTQLFPKDFQRIDCVRGGKLLDIASVHNLLWEKVTPLLPEPRPRPMAPAPATAPKPTTSSVVPAKDNPAPQFLTIQDASSLLIQKIEHAMPDVHIDYPEIPTIHTPTQLTGTARQEYEATASTLLGLYAKLVAGLAKHGVEGTTIRQLARQVLPTAATAAVRIDLQSPRIEQLIITLINDPLPEAQTAGAQIFAHAIKANPERLANADQPVKKRAPSSLRTLAEAVLPEHYVGDDTSVTLVTAWPRNELDLVADILYEYSDLPLAALRDRATTWHISHKLEILEAYFGEGEPRPALEKIHYTWDLLTSYQLFRDVQRRTGALISTQPLTPRYGFAMPPLLEEIGLDETFEKCFDLSLEWHSAIQKTGLAEIAAYATLHGHKQRWQLTLSGTQLHRLLREQSDNDPAELRALLHNMREKLGEYHPITAEITGLR